MAIGVEMRRRSIWSRLKPPLARPSARSASPRRRTSGTWSRRARPSSFARTLPEPPSSPDRTRTCRQGRPRRSRCRDVGGENDRPEAQDEPKPPPARALQERQDGHQRVLGEELLAAENHDQEADGVAERGENVLPGRVRQRHHEGRRNHDGETDRETRRKTRHHQREAASLQLPLAFRADRLVDQCGARPALMIDGLPLATRQIVGRRGGRQAVGGAVIHVIAPSGEPAPCPPSSTPDLRLRSGGRVMNRDAIYSATGGITRRRPHAGSACRNAHRGANSSPRCRLVRATIKPPSWLARAWPSAREPGLARPRARP